VGVNVSLIADRDASRLIPLLGDDFLDEGGTLGSAGLRGGGLVPVNTVGLNLMGGSCFFFNSFTPGTSTGFISKGNFGINSFSQFSNSTSKYRGFGKYFK
jgi:hypothetical protein